MPSRCSRCASGSCRCADRATAWPSIRSGRSRRLEGELPAEIEPLQSELNALIHSNQEIVDRARTQVGNLAHALKTPLAVMTNEARGDETGLGSKVAEQAQMMRDQISHYLDRARMAARVGVIGRVTPVEPRLEPLVRTWSASTRTRGIAIAVTCPPGARFQGEQQDLEEMLGNLLDNACKWAKAASILKVDGRDVARRHARSAAAAHHHGRRRRAGATAEQRAQIGKRGMRLDETKPGSGLGLSIVRDLAPSYRGRLTLEPPSTAGLKAVLDLPAA